MLIEGHATSSLDDGIVRQDPGVLASLVDNNDLILVEERELLRDRVDPDMLLSGQSLLVLVGIGLLRNRRIGDLAATALLIDGLS